MDDFSLAIKTAMEQCVLRAISNGDLINIPCAARAQLPDGFMQEVWQYVDLEGVKQQLAQRLESELADRIVNHMAAELATDIKQILSVKERREAIRHYARMHFDEIMQAGPGGGK